MYQKLKILPFALGILFLLGCESDEEKMERHRLDELYYLDNKQVAKDHSKAGWPGDVHNKAYIGIQAQCVLEHQKKIQDGKWCKKFDAIQIEYKAIDR